MSVLLTSNTLPVRQVTLTGIGWFPFVAQETRVCAAQQWEGGAVAFPEGRRPSRWRPSCQVRSREAQEATLTHPLFSPSAESASNTAPLQRSQSLPHSVTVTLGGVSDQGTPSSSALSEREASRLDKFQQLLAGPHTDLGKCPPAEDTYTAQFGLFSAHARMMGGPSVWAVVRVSHHDERHLP